MKRSRAAQGGARAVVLVCVLALGSLGLGLYAIAASGVPAPTIISAPPNPTNQTTANFTYTDSKSNVSFLCSLDSTAVTSPCGANRPSSSGYSGLTEASHTFRVKAKSGTQESAVTSYTWTIDLTPPYVVHINRIGPPATNTSSVSWEVLFSESVTGVGFDDFHLVSSGLQLPLITSVSGSGSLYTVTASTGLGSQGTLGLNLDDNDSIKDLAGNKLGGTGTGTVGSGGTGNGSFAGQVYTIDRVPPPTPVITQHPPDPSPTAVSTFAWTDSEAGVSFQCKIEISGIWQVCRSPYTFTVNTTNSDAHQFFVRAVDAAGNLSGSASYTWKVSKVGFTISGIVTDFSAQPAILYPGVWRRIAIRFTNPNNFTIYITSLNVGVSSSPTTCPGSPNIAFNQSPLSTGHTFPVPANSTATLTATDQPQIQLANLATNQDPCKGATFGLAYSGMATK